MSVISVPGGEIYFEEHGAGTPLVLAHGVGGNHAIWFQQIPALAEHYRVITFDHRGFGNSVDAAGYGRSAFVSDLLAVLDHLDVEQSALVGQSMGGGTCLGLTATHPERVSALVMCDSLHGFIESDAVKKIMDESRNATAELSQLERVLGDATRLNRPAHAALYTQLNSFNDVNRKNLIGTFSPLVAPADLVEIGVPAMFLVGETDLLFPARAVRQMHAEVPGSMFVEVSGAGHSVFFEDPARFNAEVLAFLERSLT